MDGSKVFHYIYQEYDNPDYSAILEYKHQPQLEHQHHYWIPKVIDQW